MSRKEKAGLIIGIIAIVIVGIIIAVVTAGCTGGRGSQTGGDGTAQTDESGNVAESGSDVGGGNNDNSGQTGESDESSSADGDRDSQSGSNGEITVVNGLTEHATEYEGRVGTGDFNYGEALQKSLLFYELQRSGDLSGTELRTNWRGSSGLNDGSDVGLDLTGGLYDAGDNMKFNLPMAYTSAVLAWSVYEYEDGYEESGQMEYALDTIRWVNDYLMKCHPEDDVYYYQVGDGGADHGWWGACEVMQMERPSYKVTVDNPGSAVVGEAAASLAACAVIFEDRDPEYAGTCLEHAKQLYDFAYRTKSDAGYTAANGFYNSWSGYNDELAWAGAWLYIATEDKAYLDKSEESMAAIEYNPKWTMCWDDVSTGALLMLSQLTKDTSYGELLEQNLDYWTTGMSDGSRITYTPKGLAWLDAWGSLRYATTESYIALVYSRSDMCPDDKAEVYAAFAEEQVNYALGSTGRSYVVGYGKDYPQNVHHRTAHGSYTNNINDPIETRHTLYGALAGGPDANDNYDDTRSNYTNGEVACDYNAGFTGVLAGLYEIYGGQTLVNFGAVETVDEDEFFVEAGVNVNGEDFVEIKAYVYNESAWPARVADDLEMRYFVDLSELYAAGGSASNIVISTNYMQGGEVQELQIWDEENHIYYVSVDFTGVNIYPGGQESYRKEVQVRIRNTGSDRAWDNTNDPSYAEISGTMGSVAKTPAITLYEGGKLVWGTEPEGKAGGPASEGELYGGDGTGQSGADNQNSSNDNNQGGSNSQSQGDQTDNMQANGTSTVNGLTLNVEHTTTGASANSISMNIRISNQSATAVKLDDLKVLYYFTEDFSGADWTFACYNGAVNAPGVYTGCTESVSAAFSDYTPKDSSVKADKLCTMTLAQKGLTLEKGAELTLNVCINRTDWSNFNPSNDYSCEDAGNIVVMEGSQVILGTQP